MMTTSSLLGRFDLTDFSIDSQIGGDGLVAEISAFNYFSKSRGLYSVTIGGSDRVSVIDWRDPSNPELVEQKRILGYETASVIASKGLIAVGAAPSDYGTTPGISVIKFFKMK